MENVTDIRSRLSEAVRTNVLELISGAKVPVLPSILEGLPGVILEAMYCNTPVVAYDVGVIAEVVKNNETGLQVKAGDEVGIVQAVQEVLSMSQEELQQITDHAHDVVVREYDNEVIAQRFVEVYHTYCSQAHSSFALVRSNVNYNDWGTARSAASSLEVTY